ncbi:unnamed protein product [Coccothraustes coccothraustes]
MRQSSGAHQGGPIPRGIVTRLWEIVMTEGVVKRVLWHFGYLGTLSRCSGARALAEDAQRGDGVAIPEVPARTRRREAVWDAVLAGRPHRALPGAHEEA